MEFLEFIKFLNGGVPMDTFEVGSVKIEPTIWPKVARKKETNSHPVIYSISAERPLMKKEVVCGQLNDLSSFVHQLLRPTTAADHKKDIIGTSSTTTVRVDEEKRKRVSKNQEHEQWVPRKTDHYSTPKMEDLHEVDDAGKKVEKRRRVVQIIKIKKIPQKQLPPPLITQEHVLGFDDKKNPKNYLGKDEEKRKKIGTTTNRVLEEEEELNKYVSSKKKNFCSEAMQTKPGGVGVRKKKKMDDQIEEVEERKKRRIRVIEFKKQPQSATPASTKKLRLLSNSFGRDGG